jgi:hypothetical protein
MSHVTERVPCVRSGFLVRVENLSGCSPQRSGRREGSLLSEGMALEMGPMNLRGGVLVEERRARRKAFGEAKCDVGYRAGFLVTGMPIGNEQSGRDGSIKCTVAR